MQWRMNWSCIGTWIEAACHPCMPTSICRQSRWLKCTANTNQSRLLPSRSKAMQWLSCLLCSRNSQCCIAACPKGRGLLSISLWSKCTSGLTSLGINWTPNRTHTWGLGSSLATNTLAILYASRRSQADPILRSSCGQRWSWICHFRLGKGLALLPSLLSARWMSTWREGSYRVPSGSIYWFSLLFTLLLSCLLGGTRSSLWRTTGRWREHRSFWNLGELSFNDALQVNYYNLFLSYFSNH